MESQEKYFDYSRRAQWLRAVVLGGLEGLAFTTIWLTGVEKVTHNTSTTNEMKVMLISSTLGLIAGALRIATVEFVSVYTQVDTANCQAERDFKLGRSVDQQVAVPSAIQIAVASSLAHLFWGTVPVLAAGFIRDHHLRSSIAMVAGSLSMVMLAVIGAALGKASLMSSCVRVIVGGFVAITIKWGNIKITESILDRLHIN